eukprot:270724-Alexandrium_andersonii.AAC.1
MPSEDRARAPEAGALLGGSRRLSRLSGPRCCPRARRGRARADLDPRTRARPAPPGGHRLLGRANL